MNIERVVESYKKFITGKSLDQYTLMLKKLDTEDRIEAEQRINSVALIAVQQYTDRKIEKSSIDADLKARAGVIKKILMSGHRNMHGEHDDLLDLLSKIELGKSIYEDSLGGCPRKIIDGLEHSLLKPFDGIRKH